MDFFARRAAAGGGERDMPSSRIVDLAIGLSFVFAVTAGLSSIVTELISRFLGLRGAFLLRGLRELLDSGRKKPIKLAELRGSDRALLLGFSPTAALLAGPILFNQGLAGTIADRKLTLESPEGRLDSIVSDDTTSARTYLRSLPSAIPARSFAAAVIDLIVPDSAGAATLDTIRTSVESLPESEFRSSLRALAKAAGNDVVAFRTSVERWYDDHMSRVSGWYKRRIGKITVVVGAVLVVLLNINAITIGRTLYTDNDVRSAVSAAATSGSDCAGDPDPKSCLSRLEAQLSRVARSGLPIGWTTVRDCTPPTSCNWLDRRGVLDPYGGSAWQVVLVILGFLLTITALVPGARFWYDLLGRLGSLRTSGPKAPPAR
jgi:hypothetical protein